MAPIIPSFKVKHPTCEDEDLWQRGDIKAGLLKRKYATYMTHGK
jgi:hypothetical protein